ncbi:MAG: hypothetical protein RLZ60_1193 [Pseudomonadota bacterium]
MSYLRHPGSPAGIQPKHSSIVQAICDVQRKMEAVKKSAKNQHGGYQYASADDIYAALILRMAEAGIVIDCLEAVSPEVSKSDKGSQWVKVTFQFVISTCEATWTDATCRRTVMLPLTGPQTFMAAQSYAEKTYLRSLFKIPTGDMELDEIYSADDGGGLKVSSAAAKRNGVWEDAQRAVAEADDMMALAEVDTKFRGNIPKQWRDPFSDLIARRQQEIMAAFQ